MKGMDNDKGHMGHGKDGSKKKFDGTCNVCGNHGHMAKDCGHAPKEGKAGGKVSRMMEITEETQATRITAEDSQCDEQHAAPDSWVFALTWADEAKAKVVLNARSWRTGKREHFDGKRESTSKEGVSTSRTA